MDITLDSIIRRNLSMMGLSLHYYVPMLVMAKRGLDEMHFDTLQKVKTVVISVGSNFQATLPTDFVEVVQVGIEQGNWVRPMGYDHRINTKDNNDLALSQSNPLYMYSPSEDESDFSLDEYGLFSTAQFGRPALNDDAWTINRDLGFIRINNNSSVTSIHLTYLSLPEKVSGKSVVHPFAQAALTDYIEWQWAEYTKDPNYMLKRKEFYNQYRILRGRLNKMTTVEIIRSLRKNVRLSIKN